MTFNTRPRAEYVGEGADKSSSNVGFGTKTVTPKKVQVTQRFNEEVQWADEDYQLGILDTCADEGGDALARALDLGVFHRINPLTGYRGHLDHRVPVADHELGGDLDGTGADNAPAWRRDGAGRRPDHRRRLRAQRHRVRPDLRVDAGDRALRRRSQEVPRAGLGANITASRACRPTPRPPSRPPPRRPTPTSRRSSATGTSSCGASSATCRSSSSASVTRTARATSSARTRSRCVLEVVYGWASWTSTPSPRSQRGRRGLMPRLVNLRRASSST
jgi:hypothetical protein